MAEPETDAAADADFLTKLVREAGYAPPEYVTLDEHAPEEPVNAAIAAFVPQHVCGRPTYVAGSVAAATTIRVGDLVCEEGGWVYPVRARTPQTTTMRTRNLFMRTFFGVACDASPYDHVNIIRVATTGVFSFCCHVERMPTTCLVSLDGQKGRLIQSHVVLAADKHSAIGRVAAQNTAPSGQAHVAIRSVVAPFGRHRPPVHCLAENRERARYSGYA